MKPLTSGERNSLKWLLIVIACGLSVIAGAAQVKARFGVSDMTDVNGLKIWLVHDAAHPAQCVLMVRSGVALTATPWSCQ